MVVARKGVGELQQVARRIGRTRRMLEVERGWETRAEKIYGVERGRADLARVSRWVWA
jgi:hypothetical protein